jgi:hypothetical protein
MESHVVKTIIMDFPSVHDMEAAFRPGIEIPHINMETYRRCTSIFTQGLIKMESILDIMVVCYPRYDITELKVDYSNGDIYKAWMRIDNLITTHASDDDSM